MPLRKLLQVEPHTKPSVSNTPHGRASIMSWYSPVQSWYKRVVNGCKLALAKRRAAALGVLASARRAADTGRARASEEVAAGGTPHQTGCVQHSVYDFQVHTRIVLLQTRCRRVQLALIQADAGRSRVSEQV